MFELIDTIPQPPIIKVIGVSNHANSILNVFTQEEFDYGRFSLTTIIDAIGDSRLLGYEYIHRKKDQITLPNVKTDNFPRGSLSSFVTDSDLVLITVCIDDVDSLTSTVALAQFLKEHEILSSIIFTTPDTDKYIKCIESTFDQLLLVADSVIKIPWGSSHQSQVSDKVTNIESLPTLQVISVLRLIVSMILDCGPIGIDFNDVRIALEAPERLMIFAKCNSCSLDIATQQVISSFSQDEWSKASSVMIRVSTTQLDLDEIGDVMEPICELVSEDCIATVGVFISKDDYSVEVLLG